MWRVDISIWKYETILLPVHHANERKEGSNEVEKRSNAVEYSKDTLQSKILLAISSASWSFFVSSVRVKLHYTSILRHIAKKNIKLGKYYYWIYINLIKWLTYIFFSKNIILFNITIYNISELINILSRFSINTLYWRRKTKRHFSICLERSPTSTIAKLSPNPPGIYLGYKKLMVFRASWSWVG